MADIQMISAAALAHDHTLSFTDQPALRDLFSTIKGKRRRLTLIIGAGVSMNAGLPSWQYLVSQMAYSVEDDLLQKMLRLQSMESLERKAETTIQIAKSNKNIGTAEIIRDALYSKSATPTPGILAFSIARLAALYFPEVTVLTTNFDSLIEIALRRYLDDITIDSFSIDRYEEWQNTEAQKDTLGVLHLHGMIRQGGQLPLEPLVLTESDFLEHGARVQEIVKSAVATGTTIFVGLSLTDPNIVGPLYRSADDPTANRYGFFVPRLYGPGFKPIEHARYALAGAEFLQSKLHLTPIYLKSYSQLYQLVSELSLACAEGPLYSKTAPKNKSLHYGVRFNAALSQSYQVIGAKKQTGELSADQSIALSRKLNAAAQSSKGPIRLLTKLRPDYRESISESEQFGVFLWLRTMDLPDSKKYSLTLVGSSVYAHLEPWSGGHEEPITGDSTCAAVHAIYKGGVQLENLDFEANGNTWKGVVAVPLIVVESRTSARLGPDPLDRLVIGAITLHTTKYVDAGTYDAGELSIVSQLRPDSFQSAVVDSLLHVASVALDPT